MIHLRRTRRTVTRCLILLLTLTFLAGYTDEAMAQEQQAGSVSFRVVTYNIAGGRYGDVDTLASVIASLEPDIVALQEVASNWEEASWSVDQAEALAQRLGMASFFAPIYTVEDEGRGVRRFGLAVLTRHPVVQQANHDLTRLSTQEENPVPRPMPGLAEVVVRIGGANVRVFDTHLDYRRDPAVRQQQVRDMIALLGDLGGPTLLAGDLNASPDAPELAPLFTRLRDAWAGIDAPGFTIPTAAPTHRIDYVLLSPHCTARQAFVPDVQASDHRPVVADITCAP